VSERGVYRGTYSALLDDPDWQWLSAKARLVFLTARLCKQCGPASIFRYYPEMLSVQSGVPVKDVEAALRELEDNDWIRREGVILWIRNGLRHDPNMRLVNKDHRKSIERAIAELPRLPIVLSFCEYYGIEQPANWPSGAVGDLRLREGEGVREGGTTRDRNRHPSGLAPAAAALGEGTTNGKGHGHGPAAMRTAARELLAYLNKKAEKHFQAIPANVEPIIARLREGATYDQCRAIIGLKSAEWKSDATMRKFLRPETLFNRTKFASYQGELPATAFEPEEAT
jgi:uncharacterized phage protein (TIGR02220 family)